MDSAATAEPVADSDTDDQPNTDPTGDLAEQDTLEPERTATAE